MDNLNRRLFLSAAALTYTGLTAARGEAASEEISDVTGALARYAVRAKFSEIPAPVRKEACRTLLNWLGCAIGGSHQPAVENAEGA